MAAAVIEAFGLTEYLEGPTTVILGLAGPGNSPSIARAYACRVTDHEVQIFINGQDKTLLMPPPEPGASVAMVTCRPTTLQTYQIKGRFRNLRPATAIELDWITGPIDRMVLEFAKIDLPEERSRAYFSFAPNDLMVLSFEPTAAFDQTPGPNAGARLPGYSA